LAPTLAFSLHDLGVERPADRYLQDLHRRARYGGYETWRAWWDLGYAYIRLGQPDEGEKWYAKVLENPQVSRGVAAYNLACNFAMRGMREPARAEYYKQSAIKYLRRAIVEFKYTDWQWMEEDRDLDFIRTEPGYQQLLQLLKAKYPGRTKGRISKELKDFLLGKDGDEAGDDEAKDKDKEDK
jgi:tetratricopeptide (TPR) repeat protein